MGLDAIRLEPDPHTDINLTESSARTETIARTATERRVIRITDRARPHVLRRSSDSPVIVIARQRHSSVVSTTGTRAMIRE
jgi:hypothetical protein